MVGKTRTPAALWTISRPPLHAPIKFSKGGIDPGVDVGTIGRLGSWNSADGRKCGTHGKRNRSAAAEHLHSIPPDLCVNALCCLTCCLLRNNRAMRRQSGRRSCTEGAGTGDGNHMRSLREETGPRWQLRSALGPEPWVGALGIRAGHSSSGSWQTGRSRCARARRVGGAEASGRHNMSHGQVGPIGTAAVLSLGRDRRVVVAMRSSSIAGPVSMAGT